MGSEEVIEEAFLDVFCDLVYGGGWMDLERVEETDRECNWALVSCVKSSLLYAHTFYYPRSSSRLCLLDRRLSSAVELNRERDLPSSFSRSSFHSSTDNN
jgi:hypothetical protein